MSEILAGVRYLAYWYWLGLRYAAREYWRALPGPWYVKVLLIIITRLIPGEADDVALLLIVKLFRTWRAHRAVA